MPVREYEKDSAEPKTPRKVNLNTLAVWDLDKEAWRAFNLDSVKNFKNAV
jgi:hypothetical protein